MIKKYKRYLKKTIIISYMFIINKVLGVKKDKVVFISFNGESYSDNPKAISEKLYKQNPNIEIVWIFNDIEKKKEYIPGYIKCVRNNSFTALKELATSKIWVDNFTKSEYIYKSKKQIYIQTWHGDRGFKKILYDSNFVKLDFKIPEKDICDLAIAGSEYGKMQYISAFKYNKDILMLGTPRNDILIEGNDNECRKIKNTLGIDSFTNILLYAPTLRRESSNNKSKQSIGDIDLIECLSTLELKTKQKWICLVRSHKSIVGLSGVPQSDKIIDVSSYEDMSDLLLVTDMLITDYSSSAGDFALRKKPIILYQSDRKQYIEKDRDFYFDIDQSPFIVAMNQEELINIMKINDKEYFIKNCTDILAFYKTNETGKASEAVVEYIKLHIEEKCNEK